MGLGWGGGWEGGGYNCGSLFCDTWSYWTTKEYYLKFILKGYSFHRLKPHLDQIRKFDFFK